MRLTPSQRMQKVQLPVIPTVARMIEENPGTISLGQGVVYYPPPPEAILAAQQFGKSTLDHRYGPVDGLPLLREKIAVKLQCENGIALTDNVRLMITGGANMAFLNVMMCIADPDDEIILPTPYYFNQEMAIRMVSAKPVCVPTDQRFQPDLAKIEAAITQHTRAIVTISPNNPSGAVYTEAALRSINALCYKYGLYHISDEAYEYFVYEGATHYSPASAYDADAHTISLFSLSKAYGFASWRIGYVTYPAHLQSAMLKAQDTNLICATGIAQHAAIGALTAGATYCKGKNKDIQAIRRFLLEELRSLSRQIEVVDGHGALYFLVKANTDRSAYDLVEQLVRQYRVAAIPGETFGLVDDCYFRVSFGALDQATATRGIERLINGLQHLLS